MRMVWAMAKVENGDRFITEADMETVRKGYELAVSNVNLNANPNDNLNPNLNPNDNLNINDNHKADK